MSRRLPTVAVLAFAAFATSSILAAQDRGSLAATSAFEAWRGAKREWRAVIEPRTGFVEFVSGGRARPSSRPTDEAGFVAAARAFAAETAAFTGVDPDTLVFDRQRFLPLAQVGSTDKIAVRFEQEVKGIDVIDGSMNVLLDLDGNLLALQSTALPGLGEDHATAPTVGADTARDHALARFEAQSGLSGADASAPRLAIARHESRGVFEPRLVWEVDVRWSAPDLEPEGATVWIDARSGAPLRSVTNVHRLDVGGTVVANATSGLFPDSATNPPILHPLANARVISSAGTATTDANGAFLFPGVTGPLSVTIVFVGDFARVVNLAGSAHFVNETISGTSNLLTMNAAPTEFVTAQANAFLQIGHLRSWIRSVDPLDDTADFQALAEVNLMAGCNAVFDGDSVIFHRENLTLGCPSTAYSTVVAHEMGHWLNERYHTRNLLDGMGEGNADTFAMYSYDTPIIGQDFFGPGAVLRTGENARLFCGDCCPGCHGPIPHDNGEVWMGAAWKLRARLNATHGDAQGDAIADTLFLAWMNGFDQMEIKSVIEAQWLALDDDDGYALNGTPHYADIDAGFREQGFPGVDLAPVAISGVTELADTLDESGPYVVDATIVALANPPLFSAEILYRVDGSAWVTLPMSASGLDVYTASIPGQSAISKVEYHVRAVDSAGVEVLFPASAPAASRRFHVGLFERFFDDFEGGTNGWTQASYQDTPNWNDDFQHGLPHGKAGDPAAAASGVHVRGNNLGAANLSGAYQPNVHAWLRSPVVDCSNATGTRLRFRRWLTVEPSVRDQARVSVNGVLVAQNAPNVETADVAWTWLDYDVSAIADGEPAVQIEFELQSDASVTRGGWNLDDVQLVSMGPGGDCLPPTSYGEAKESSLGIRSRVGSIGTPSASGGGFQLTLSDGVPGQPALVFYGVEPDNTPLFGGSRLVAPPFERDASLALDGTGAFVHPVSVTPRMIGTSRYYQVWFRDPAHPDGTGVCLSDALAVVFCP